METGYVLFNLKSGTKKDFIKKVKDIKAVKEARLVIGIWDAIAKLKRKA